MGLEDTTPTGEGETLPQVEGVTAQVPQLGLCLFLGRGLLITTGGRVEGQAARPPPWFLLTVLGKKP